ncbi:MAG: ATP-binding protein [Deltaproteobacteria bacterium]|nr:ATP-binding protein [Deltaproteobacteria bacterium]MBL7216405.1 ATP-binding protein [Desulfobacteraceae bacterium]
MNQKELLEIIRNGESSKVEFKREEVHPNSLAEEIVAFANFEGGIILIGVDDSGELIGCFRDDIDEFVVNVCRNSIRPSIIPVIESILVDGKKIVIVTIPRGDTAYSTNRGLYSETLEKCPLSKSELICPISASGSDYNPRNISYIPVGKTFAFLDLEQNWTFFNGSTL